ncbi:MAG: MFS transporter [Succinivibrionaceae bacterium]|nr:MFS transporter [Succinivibrionaceae bacterium]
MPSNNRKDQVQGPTPLERLALGLGAGAQTAVALVPDVFLIFFLLDFARVPPATVAAALFCSALVSLALRPLIPSLLRPSHLGEARVWLMRLLLPAAAALVLPFAIPHQRQVAVDFAFVLISYCLLCAVVKPLLGDALTLLTRNLSRDLGEQARLSRARLLGTALTVMIVGLGAAPLLTYHGLTFSCFLKSSLPLAALTALALCCCALYTHERVPPGNRPVALEQVSAALRAMRGSPHLLRLLGMALLSTLATVIFNAAQIFYLRHYLGDFTLIGPMLCLMAALALAAALSWSRLPGLSAWAGHRRALALGLSLAALGCLLRPLLPTSLPLAALALGLQSLGLGLCYGQAFFLLRDAALHTECEQGINCEDLMRLAMEMAIHVAYPLGLTSLALLLCLCGYGGTGGDSGPGMAGQDGILLAVGLVPAALYALALLLALSHRLDLGHGELLRRAGERRARSAVIGN